MLLQSSIERVCIAQRPNQIPSDYSSDLVKLRDCIDENLLKVDKLSAERSTEALNLFKQLSQNELNNRLNSNTSASLLSACIHLRLLTEGKRIHAYIITSSFRPNIFLSNVILNMYMKCDTVENARLVFDGMPLRNVCTWTILITGYCQHGEGNEALNLFRQMKLDGKLPNKVTFVNIICACGNLCSLGQGKLMHANASRLGYELDVLVGSVLIDMYFKCGNIDDACKLFNIVHVRDVVSWNTMISGCVQHGYHKEALRCFEWMQNERVKLNKVVYLCIVGACAYSGAAYEYGKKVHAEMVRAGVQFDLFVGNALLNMYTKCISMTSACQLFNRMPVHDNVSWNTIIGGYAEQWHGNNEGLCLFNTMKKSGTNPDGFTFVRILGMCVSLMALNHVHAHVIKSGYGSNTYVSNVLIDLYGKHGDVEASCQVFNRMLTRDVVSWSSMLGVYSLHGLYEKALMLYRHLKNEGVEPDDVTFINILNVCASLQAVKIGKQIHVEVQEAGYELVPFVYNTIIDMYAKCGRLKDAHKMFDRISARDAGLWNVIIAGYSQNGNDGEALKQFEQMELEGIKPDSLTFVSVLSACGNLGYLERGKKIHIMILEAGYEQDGFVANALSAMYAKCGCLQDAEQVFCSASHHSLASWNTIMVAYSQYAHYERVVNIVRKLLRDGILPNSLTFGPILGSCSHAYLIDESWHYFCLMSLEYGIRQTGHHFSCLVDLLGHLGWLDEAEEVITAMPFPGCFVVWTTLLDASTIHGDVGRAVRSIEQF